MAVDPGSHSIKILLVEELFGRVRVLRSRLVDLQEEGLLSGEEIQRHVQEVLRDFGSHPVALTLPQHQSLSQVVDLQAAVGAEVRRLIEEETVKLSGLSESAIIYDYAPLGPFGKYHCPYWVTLCQETEVLQEVRRIGLAEEDICEVTTTANALAAAYRTTPPGSDRVVLVDLGATNTVVAVLNGHQAVHASSFPLGSEGFTEEIAARRNCSLEGAESIKSSEDLLNETNGNAPLAARVGIWFRELQRVINESHAEQEGGASPSDAGQVVLSGGGALQPGLIDHLNRLGATRFSLWPSEEDPQDRPVPARFAVAFGTALQAFGKNPQSASLLPVELRAAWKKHRTLELLHSGSAMVVVLTALLLAFGTWQKLRWLSHKKTLLAETQTALEKARATDSLTGLLFQQYEALRPILQRQRETWDTLKAVSALQQARSNQSFWYLLFADEQSYYSARLPASTNPPAPATTATNFPPPRYGFVAEICVPEEPEAMRRTLSQIVTDLKKYPLFRNVDALSADRRRNLVDPKLVVPDRTAALELELVENAFHVAQKPLERRVPLGPELRPPPRPSGRSPERPAASAPSGKSP
jgi:Tfp pilus assembly PilM family ATPase